jgi:hypothetical protein
VTDHVQVGVGAIPKQQLHAIGSHPLDLRHAPVQRKTGLAATGRFVEPEVLEGDEQASISWDIGLGAAEAVVWVNQDGRAQWAEMTGQDGLCNREVVIARGSRCHFLPKGLQHRRTLINGHHLEPTLLIGEAAQATKLTGGDFHVSILHC